MYCQDNILLNEDKTIHGASYDVNNVKWSGLGHAFFESMQTYSDRTAQIDALTGRKESYKELLTRCIRTAISMQESGIGLGDVILICSYNNMDTCVPYISAMFLGAVTTGLHPGLPRSDIEKCLKQTKPKMIFIEVDAVKTIEDSVRLCNFPTQFVVFGDTNVHTPYSHFLAPKNKEADFFPFKLPNLKETASIYFTSGSTGPPKLVCVSQYALLHQFRCTGFTKADLNVCLYFSTMYWITSGMLLVLTILNGSTRLICKALDRKTIWKHISNYKVSFLFLTPTGLQELYNEAVSSQNIDPLSLRVIQYGGSPTPLNLIANVKKLLPNMVPSQAYGLTETAGAVLKFDLTDPKQRTIAKLKPESCGRPIPGTLYKVVDAESGQNVGFNKLGELRIKSDFFMTGYANADNSSIYDEDGWLKTGDIAYFDDDFCFYIIERIKDLLKIENFQIAPASIECVVCSHPAVKFAAVVSTLTDAHGDIPVACVVLNKGYEKIKEEEIQQFVEKQVDSLRKLRGGVMFFNSLPTTATGKINKSALKNLLKTSR